MNDIADYKWYPMRVTYGRELKVKASLDSLGIDNYVPMTYHVVESQGERHKKLVPAIHNLIFIHSSLNVITGLKFNNALFCSLRYITRKSIVVKDAHSEIITVPANQMGNFIKATKGHEEDVTYLKCENNIAVLGERVRITDGIFFGVEGCVVRIQKNKHVVVNISSISSVMLNFVPNAYLEKVNDNDDNSFYQYKTCAGK